MRVVLPLVLLLLTACGGEAPKTPDATATANPPAKVEPQAIGYPDIEANNLYGAGCAYASGTSMAPLVLAMADEAAMKIDAEIVRFKADPQAADLPLGSHARYTADDRVLELSVTGEGTQSGEETARFDGSIRLTDAAGSVLYATEGAVQCGS